jgi:two-component system OmpR family response regulator
MKHDVRHMKICFGSTQRAAEDPDVKNEPSGSEASRPGRNGFEAFNASGQRVSTERIQPICLVVEDDHTTRHLVTNYLGEHDIRAISASRLDEVAGLLVREEPNLVILDLRLCQEDGLDLLREIRSRSDVPVIITTGHRRDEIDRVVGLELGADDYITKPFGLRELLARIRAVLRRREAGQAAVQRDPERGRCRFGGWQLDRRNRRLTDPNGIPVALTKGEYALLIAFLDAPQRPLSREHLLQATRIHEDVFDRSIDVQVLRLRRKLETDPNAPRVISTERGVGYVFALPVEAL